MLDLNESPLKEASLELVEVVRKYKLPFKLYYHEETLKELRHVIVSAGTDSFGISSWIWLPFQFELNDFVVNLS